MSRALTIFFAALLIAVAISAFAARDTSQVAGSQRKPAPAVLPSAAIPQESPLASQLERVPDIRAETIEGQLPRLPHHIPAVYRRKAEGPDVRVIWPSPKDNSQVLKPGSYTVTGKVPGTQFQPSPQFSAMR